MPNKRLVTALAVGFLAVVLSVLPSITPAHAEQCVTRGTPPVCVARCEVDEYVKARIKGGGCGSSAVTGTPSYQLVCCKLGEVNKGHTTTGSVNPCDDMVGPGYDYVQPSGQPGRCVKKSKSMKKVKCSNPNATYNGQTKRCELPMKQMGKEYTGPKDKSALKRACDLQNWVWNEKTGRCRKPSQAKADCEARGSNYRYDLDTGGCVGGMSKGKRKSEAKADCEARGRRFRFDFDTGRCVKRVDMSDDQEFDDEDFQPQKKKKKRKIDLDIDIF